MAYRNDVPDPIFNQTGVLKKVTTSTEKNTKTTTSGILPF